MKVLSAEEMAKIDFLAIEKYGITLLQMMELAGFNLAELTSRLFPVKDLRVSILVGKANNGGGGLSAARHITNRGALVNVILSQKDGLKPAVNHQLHTLKRMKLPISIYNHSEFPESDVILDALLGYNLKGNPRQPIADMIRAANTHSSPIISLDMPSGLSATTGEIMDPCIEANYTMTLAYPKRGYSEKVVGKLFVADIGLPLDLYKELGLDFPDFFTWKT
ncbi:NAD(P)H-hydrate epimerase [Thermoproteota archaeon]